jgi:hypothetical protein
MMMAISKQFCWFTNVWFVIRRIETFFLQPVAVLALQSLQIFCNFNMFSLKASDIYDIFKPLHVCSRLTGLTSFNVKKENDSYVESYTIFNILCISITSFFATSVHFFNFYNIDVKWNKEFMFVSDVLLKSMIAIILTSMISTLIINWWTFFFRKHYVSILNKLNDVDDHLKRLGVELNYRESKKKVVIFTIVTGILIWSSLILMKFLQKDFKIDNGWLSIFVLIQLCQNQALLPIQYICFLKLVKNRYQKLNFVAESLLFDEFLLKKDENHQSKMEVQMKSIATIHDKLVDVSEAMNHFFGVPVSATALFLLD